MEETIIPIKFNRKLNIKELDTLVDILDNFTSDIHASMEIISISAVSRRALANDQTSEKDLRVCEVNAACFKNVDYYYKEWYGESHLNTSNIPTHDSAEAADFADYYYNEKSKPLKVMLNKILSIEDAAFGLKGFDYQRLKSEIRGALSDARTELYTVACICKK